IPDLDGLVHLDQIRFIENGVAIRNEAPSGIVGMGLFSPLPSPHQNTIQGTGVDVSISSPGGSAPATSLALTTILLVLAAGRRACVP
ncbi:MAG: hypothetical protein LC620_06350, partial [Halobacteriales archaeon]|nr:hypothetical protein [Halobacteriales archaeon]